jgi:pyruvate,water dikinase
LSVALRKAFSKVSDEDLDDRKTPEVMALRSLQELANTARPLVQSAESSSPASGSETVFITLAKTAEGTAVLEQLEDLIYRYGYLSEVGTDIAVPTWKENPAPVRALFAEFCLHPPTPKPSPQGNHRKVQGVQRRLDIKGQVTEVYSRLLAELRWSFVELEQNWLKSGRLQTQGDLFFLTLDEIRQQVQSKPSSSEQPILDRIQPRKANLERDRQIDTVPFIVYGNDPPEPAIQHRNWTATQQLRGIGASPGTAEGAVKIIQTLEDLPDVARDTILVVPYTDSGWAPLLARAGGLIAEVGGRLSHGAIVAREYGIPAVMDVHHATQQLHDGQRVRIDGQQGTVEIL